jgi:hypothetical protein
MKPNDIFNINELMMEGMADEFAAMAMKKFPKATVRKNGETLQSMPEKPKAPVVTLTPEQVSDMEQRLEKLKAEYSAMGGDSWQYADRMMPRDQKAKEIYSQMNSLAAQVARAKHQGVAEGSKYKCTCHPGDPDPDCPVHGLEPMEVGDALDVKKGVAEGYPKHQDLSGISTDKLKAYLAKQSQQSVPGEGNQVKRVRAELQSREQGVAEETTNNPEYSDEVGYVKDNLHTIVRICKMLNNTMVKDENLPDWVQEKVAQAKGMLVASADYLQSQHEQGRVYTNNEEGTDDKYKSMFEATLNEFSSAGGGAGSIATSMSVGSPNAGSLFGGSYSQKNSPFKGKKPKKPGVIKR